MKKKDGKLQYPEDWIVSRYVNAVDPKGMISILAELNDVGKSVIEEILRRRGVLKGRQRYGKKSYLYRDEISGEIMDTARAAEACGIGAQRFGNVIRREGVIERNGRRFVLHGKQEKQGK